MIVEIERQLYELGDEVSGTARWEPGEKPPIGAIVELQWWTEGRGDRSSGVGAKSIVRCEE